MIARNHLATSLGVGLGVAALAISLGQPVTLGAIPLVVTAWGGGEGPDIDAPPRHGPKGAMPGSIAAEAHGPLSRTLAHVVNRTHRGHRGYTHRLWYPALLAIVVGLCARAQARETTAVVVAIFATYPLFCAMPGHRRGWLRRLGPLGWLGTEHVAWAYALALGVALAVWAPAGGWLGPALGLGWASHILADRAQSACWSLGGTVEHVVACAVLGAGALLLADQLGVVAWATALSP